MKLGLILGEEQRNGSQAVSYLVPVLPFTSCVSGESLNFSKPQFSHL